MDRYWVFAGSHYYPSGGMHDFVCSSDSEEEAQKLADDEEKTRRCDWAHVWDTVEQGIIYTA